MMDSRDDVGFSSVSWIRQGLLELDRLKDNPFQNWGLIKINTQSGIVENKNTCNLTYVYLITEDM